jgi:DNA-binding Lrp family transcriptional regulator
MAANTLSEKELSLLGHLRQDSRKSLALVSKQANIPTSTLFDLLKKIEQRWITRHSSLVDFSKLGYNVKVHFTLSTPNKKAVKDFMMAHPNVNTLCSLINDADFFAECVFIDLKEMQKFKDDLDKLGISSLQENFVVEDVSKEVFLPR